MDQKVKTGGLAELVVDNGETADIFYIFYLVTKPIYFHKPRFESLADTLLQLRDRLMDLNICRLIIPKLGCCLDGLDWYKVRGLIQEIWADNTNMIVTVCDPEKVRLFIII